MHRRVTLVEKHSDTVKSAADIQYQSLANAIKDSIYQSVQTEFDDIEKNISTLPKITTEDAGSSRMPLLSTLIGPISSMQGQIGQLLNTHKEAKSDDQRESLICDLDRLETEFYSDDNFKKKIKICRDLHGKIAAFYQLIQVENGFEYSFESSLRKAIVERHFEEIKRLKEEITEINALNKSLAERINFTRDAKDDLSEIQNIAITAFADFKKFLEKVEKGDK
jgi:hypothetical protein